MAKESIVDRPDALKHVLDAASPIPAVAGEAGGIVEDRTETGSRGKSPREFSVAARKCRGFGLRQAREWSIEDVRNVRRFGEDILAGKRGSRDQGSDRK